MNAKLKLVAAAVLTPLQAVEAEMSPAQVVALTEMSAFIADHAGTQEAFTVEMIGFCEQAFPVACPWAAWKTALAYVKAEVEAIGHSGNYALKCLRSGYKSIYDELPSAGDARASGKKKGASAAKWAQGFNASVKALTDRMAKMPRRDLNAARMARIAKLVASLALEIKAERADLKAA